MPTAEWAQYLADRGNDAHPTPVRSRGYQPEVWNVAESLRAVAPRLPTRLSLPGRVTRAGDCPNSSRVYFSLVSSETADPHARDTIAILFGKRCGETRLVAGQIWDDHVTRANRAMNRHLKRMGEQFRSKEIREEPIRSYYNRQLGSLAQICQRRSIQPTSLAMRTQFTIRRRRQRVGLASAKPDGMWLAEKELPPVGGMFESKLSLPPDGHIRRTFAAYALLAEQRFQIDFDQGIALTWNEAELTPVPHAFTIGESDRQSCLDNVAKLRDLLALSSVAGSGTRLKVQPEWGRILARPPRPPLAPECGSCEFRSQCRLPEEING